MSMLYDHLSFQVHVTKMKILARFGFAHLIATNFCIWLRTLVNEISHEYHHLAEESHVDANYSTSPGAPAAHLLPIHSIVKRATAGETFHSNQTKIDMSFRNADNLKCAAVVDCIQVTGTRYISSFEKFKFIAFAIYLRLVKCLILLLKTSLSAVKCGEELAYRINRR